MNEATRMQYLDAMGIDMFVHRLILPAAKTSYQCMLPEAPAPSNQADTLTDVSHNAAHTSGAQSVGTMRVLDALRDSSTVNRDSLSDPKGTQTKELSDSFVPSVKPSLSHTDIRTALDESGGAPQIDAAARDAVTESKSAAIHTPQAPDIHDQIDASQHNAGASHDNKSGVYSSDVEMLSQPAQFMLNLWRVSADVLVVDSQKKIEPLPKEQLLQNILRAVRIGHNLPKADPLNWPMVTGVSKDKSWRSAQEMVSYFLEGRLFTSPVKYIFIFGTDAQKAILNTSPEEKSGSVMLTGLGAKAVYFPSLGEILLQPKLKASVWRALQAHYLSELP